MIEEIVWMVQNAINIKENCVFVYIRIFVMSLKKAQSAVGDIVHSLVALEGVGSFLKDTPF